MSEGVRGMFRVEERDAIWYIRHNLRRGAYLCTGGAVLTVVSFAVFLAPERGMIAWALAGTLFLIGAGLIVIGCLALRERVYFRISTVDDEVELRICSGGEKSYRTKRSRADRVVLELAANAPRTADDAWGVRVSGFGDKLIQLSKGPERAMKTLARQLAQDLGAELEEPRGFTTRHG